jgi:hypothetical protein
MEGESGENIQNKLFLYKTLKERFEDSAFGTTAHCDINMYKMFGITLTFFLLLTLLY